MFPGQGSQQPPQLPQDQRLDHEGNIVDMQGTVLVPRPVVEQYRASLQWQQQQHRQQQQQQQRHAQPQRTRGERRTADRIERNGTYADGRKKGVAAYSPIGSDSVSPIQMRMSGSAMPAPQATQPHAAASNLAVASRRSRKSNFCLALAARFLA